MSDDDEMQQRLDTLKHTFSLSEGEAAMMEAFARSISRHGAKEALAAFNLDDPKMQASFSRLLVAWQQWEGTKKRAWAAFITAAVGILTVQFVTPISHLWDKLWK